MGAFKYIKQSFAASYAQRSQAFRRRLHYWREGPSVARVDKPLNPARARELGYKAKKEFIVARVRVPKGRRRRPAPSLGRKPAKNRKFENPGKPWQWFAEQRAMRRFPNLRVFNSYWVGEDGQSQYYEVLMLDENSKTPRRPPKAAKENAVKEEKAKRVQRKPLKSN